MIDIDALFAIIAAMLEDMHGVAVDAQAKDLTPDEGAAFAGMLQAGLVRLERQVQAASEALNR